LDIKLWEAFGCFKVKYNRDGKENKKLRMEIDILKQVALVMSQVEMIKRNAKKYVISAMCKVLKISRVSKNSA
jgi:hypothetical protein